MSEVTQQRPMNEYVNIMNQQIVTHDLGWHFLTSQQIFICTAKKKARGQPSDVIVPAFPFE